MKNKAKYTVSQEKKTGDWYCHLEGYPYIPVFGSIGTKQKADMYRKMMNRSIGREEAK